MNDTPRNVDGIKRRETADTRISSPTPEVSRVPHTDSQEIERGTKKTEGTTLLQKIIIGIVAVIFLLIFYIALDANKYPALVKAIEGEGRIGVNPTDQALDFGDLSKGTSAVRHVRLKNGTFMPLYIAMVKTGSIASLIQIDNNHFKLAPNSETTIDYTVRMPASATIDKTYKGRVYLFKIPTFGL